MAIFRGMLLMGKQTEKSVKLNMEARDDTAMNGHPRAIFCL